MIDRRLWDDESVDERDRELLLSMRGDAPSPEARRRMLATLGLVGAGTAMAPTAVLAKKGLAALLASKGAAALLAKTALVAVVATAVAVSVSVAVKKRATPIAPVVATAVPIVSVAAPEPVASTAPVPVVAPPIPLASAPIEKAKPSAASVTEAIALLDSARKALNAGEVDRAVAQLARYDARFPSGPLRPEADLLRIEVFVRRGDRASAEALADAITTQLPGSAHARRARALLESNAP